MKDEKLAIEGGFPVRSEIFPSWPYYAQDEIDAVSEILASGKVNYWTGDEGRRFEEEFAEFSGCTHTVALANGTAALETALHALCIGPGDEVVVPSRTFIASASCVVQRGATPVMADVDDVSQNLTAETIRPAITPRTRAVIAVHLAGWPCDIEPILEEVRSHDIKVIEDCAQACGSAYKGIRVGSFGDVAAFSFCQDKIISTGGEGGMLTTNKEDIWKKAWSYRDHGKSYDTVQKNKNPGFRWLHETFGTNLRMTELQAAIGRLQLGKISAWVEKRSHNAAMLNECFSGIQALRVTLPSEDITHSYYKHYAFVRSDALREGWNRDRIMNAINAEGVPCFSGSCSEIYLEKAFITAGLTPPERLPVARRLGETSLTFLVHPTLGDQEMEDTCQAVMKVFRKAMN